MWQEIWSRLTHRSARAYSFRLKYVMGPIHDIVARTPSNDRESYQHYEHAREEKYRNFTAGRSVLDTGCGPGEWTARFREYGATLSVGADLSAGMVTDALERHPRIPFVVADVCHLPFADGSFDIVHSTRLFHHVPVPVRRKAVDEQRRVAKQLVLLEDLFGVDKGLARFFHWFYYTLADGSAYRFTLTEWRDFLGVALLQEMHSDPRTLRGRRCLFVLKVAHE